MKYIVLFVFVFAGQVNAQTASDLASIGAGRNVYDVFCQTCHGPEGRGDGPFSEFLRRSPTDLTTLSAINGGAFPVVRTTFQIDGRDPLPGHGGEMPVFGPIFDSDFGTLTTQSGQPILTSQSIADLIHWLESIQEVN